MRTSEAAAHDSRIVRALAPAATFARVCGIGREDGGGVIAADGAEQAKVATGGDRYRLPAVVKPNGAAA